jgi:hypothetical protein
MSRVRAGRVDEVDGVGGHAPVGRELAAGHGDEPVVGAMTAWRRDVGRVVLGAVSASPGRTTARAAGAARERPDHVGPGERAGQRTDAVASSQSISSSSGTGTSGTHPGPRRR